ncbi:hypothetical protein QLG25_05760 [Pseudomonas sp. CBR-F]
MHRELIVKGEGKLDFVIAITIVMPRTLSQDVLCSIIRGEGFFEVAPSLVVAAFNVDSS